MKEIAAELDAELVKLDDGEDRSGLGGWLKSGMQAMARRLPPVKKPETIRPLSIYSLVVIGTPVWAGRCSAPVRSFLREYGGDLRRVAYLITRGSDNHYEEVYRQMDFYLNSPHISAASIRLNSVGAAFWRDEFLKGLQTGKEEDSGHAE